MLKILLMSFVLLSPVNLILYVIFEHRYTTFFIKNKLYICKGFGSCGRLFRHYQASIQKSSELRCPHCSKQYAYLKQVKEKPWTKYHSDCPSMSYLGLTKFYLDVHRIKRNKQSVEDIEFFEKYNARKPNVDWINNITKNKD